MSVSNLKRPCECRRRLMLIMSKSWNIPTTYTQRCMFALLNVHIVSHVFWYDDSVHKFQGEETAWSYRRVHTKSVSFFMTNEKPGVGRLWRPVSASHNFCHRPLSDAWSWARLDFLVAAVTLQLTITWLSDLTPTQQRATRHVVIKWLC